MAVKNLCLLSLVSLISATMAMIGDSHCQINNECHECADTYTVDHKHIAVPVGCYNSRGDDVGNALPYQDHTNHRDGHGNDILWPMWNCTGDATQIISEFCGKEAVARGKSYFGVEFYGECYFGDEKDIDKSQGLVPTSECTTRCKWDVGGPHTMMIYKVKDVKAGHRCSVKVPPPPQGDCVNLDGDPSTTCGNRPDGDYPICYPECKDGHYVTCSNGILYLRVCALSWYVKPDGQRFTEKMVYDPALKSCQRKAAYCPRKYDSMIETA